jgi:predicted unusual protein kinase regulating ubiquinone biosynthesis (AarF/ABC1/UbiB family)
MSPRFKARHSARYREIAALLVKHGRGDMVRAAGLDASLPDEEAEHGDPEAAAGLAEDLERMGPTYIKLGQLLSTRVDLISPAYVEALSRLQDDVAPFDFAEVEHVVTTELGVRLSTVFPTFDPKPLAAASLGQVHRATLRDGREVVVKVQRPGIREQIVEDMEVLRELAALLDAHTDFGQRFGIGDLLEEFRRSLIDELDYRREAENLTTIGTMLAGHRHIVVPKPYPDFTTSRVLTMEFVPGRKVTDLGPLGRLELDGAPLADELFGAYIRQVLVDGVFHADPHPGNVLVTDDGRLVLLDIGMVARVTPAHQEKLLKLLLALADARPDEVVRVARTMGQELPDWDRVRFERTVARVVSRATESSLADLELGAILLQLIREAGECGLRMDPELTMIGKAILNLDQVATVLDPDFDPFDALRRHTTELMRTSMRSSPAAVLATMLEAKEFAEALPGRVNRAFDAIGEGNFELRIKAFDEDEFLRGLHKLANVIAAGLVLAAMILASAFLARSSESGPTTTNTIALVVFVVAILIALTMLGRILWQSHQLRSRR